MTLFSSKNTEQACVLLAGHVPQELTAAFVQHAQQSGLPVCQFIHSTAGERFSVNKIDGQDVFTGIADLTDHQALARCIKKLKKRAILLLLALSYQQSLSLNQYQMSQLKSYSSYGKQMA